MSRLLLIVFLMILVFGCSYPSSSIRVTDNRPSIVVQNAPQDAILLVDGLNMGRANQYSGGDRALLVEPGTHKIEVMYKLKSILSERVFIGGGELKVFKVYAAPGDEE